MEIWDSTRKHGVADEDILHAVDNPIRYREEEYDGELRVFMIGADRSGFSNSFSFLSTGPPA